MSKFSVDTAENIRVAKESPNARGGKMEITPGIILSKLDIKENDTILVTIDSDRYHLEEAYDIFKTINNSFPHNNVIATFKGVEIKGIKDKKLS